MNNTIILLELPADASEVDYQRVINFARDTEERIGCRVVAVMPGVKATTNTEGPKFSVSESIEDYSYTVMAETEGALLSILDAIAGQRRADDAALVNRLSERHDAAADQPKVVEPPRQNPRCSECLADAKWYTDGPPLEVSEMSKEMQAIPGVRRGWCDEHKPDGAKRIESFEPPSPVIADERKPGRSKIVYDKTKRTIVAEPPRHSPETKMRCLKCGWYGPLMSGICQPNNIATCPKEGCGDVLQVYRGPSDPLAEMEKQIRRDGVSPLYGMGAALALSDKIDRVIMGDGPIDPDNSGAVTANEIRKAFGTPTVSEVGYVQAAKSFYDARPGDHIATTSRPQPQSPPTADMLA